MLKIERIEYKTRGAEVRPWIKKVLTAVDEKHYLCQVWTSNQYGDWVPHSCTTYFDGKKVHNGVIRTSLDTVEVKFKMLVEYEGYHYVEEDVETEDTCKEED